MHLLGSRLRGKRRLTKAIASKEAINLALCLEHLMPQLIDQRRHAKVLSARSDNLMPICSMSQLALSSSPLPARPQRFATYPEGSEQMMR